MTGMDSRNEPAATPLLDQLKKLTSDDKPISLDVCRALAAVIPFSQRDYLISKLLDAVNPPAFGLSGIKSCAQGFESPAVIVASLKMIFSFVESRPEKRLGLLAHLLESQLIPLLS